MSFLRTEKRVPDNLTASSESISSAISVWSLEFDETGSPTFLITTLSSSLVPRGTLEWGIFGISSKKSSIWICNSLRASSPDLRPSFILLISFFKSSVGVPAFLRIANSADNRFLSDWTNSTSIWRVFLLASNSLNFIRSNV